MSPPARRQIGGELPLVGGGEMRHAELQGCTLLLPNTPSLSWHGSRLVDCCAQGGDLGTLHGCCLRGVTLRALRVHALVDCDLHHAVLDRVDLRGADLRGARLQGATLRHCLLDGVRVDGAELDGIQGLTRQTLTDLYAAGARPPRPWLRRSGSGLALIALAPLLALASLPGGAPQPRVASEAEWRLPPDAVAQTQSGLHDFRAGVQAAHLSMKGPGGRTYPTLEEVQANQYDLDGDGPGQTLGVLFPKGLPRNLLSPIEGSVLPYCNATPDQATLGEEDVDWHYCPETGRVLASAGHTEHPTVDW